MIPVPPVDHQPFLQAIAANPQDDLPRLIFADYLEETGEPEFVARAHYIRAQIGLEGADVGSEAGRETAALIERIQDMFADTFHLELPLWLVEDCKFAYRRGFLDSIQLDLEQFQREAAALCASYPIQSLHLRGGYYYRQQMHFSGQWFDQFPFLQQILHLGFGPHFTPLVPIAEELNQPDLNEMPLFFQSLMTSRVLAQIQSLDFTGNQITDGWLVQFVSRLERAPFARNLRHLNFTDCLLITNAGANVLSTARSLDALESLNLKSIQFSDATRRMLRLRFGPRLTL